jgi:hypothetical protein
MEIKMVKPDQSVASDDGDGVLQQQDQDDQEHARPAAMRAVSARLPATLVKELLDEAARRGIKPSELIRQAVESLLHGESDKTADFNVSVGYQMTVMTPLSQYQTENPNLVVEVPTEPAHLVALGYDL